MLESYYSRNKEKSKKKNLKYYKENKEAISKQRKIYREANKDKIREHRKKFYLENIDKYKVARRKYYEHHKKHIIEKSKKYHLDNKEKMEGYYKKYRIEYYKKNYNRLRQKHRECHIKLRRKVLLHYGGKCFCCGENRFEFLAIDHIYGGGNQERKKLNMGGATFYRYIIREGYPKTLRILCYNCNNSIGYYGYCPHQFSNKK